MRFGFLANASTTHLRSMAAVGAALRKRGHRVIFFQVPDFKSIIESVGLEYRAVESAAYPLGTIGHLDAELGQLNGLQGLKYSIGRSVDQARLFLEVLPAVILEEGIDVLVIDDVELYGFTLAEFLAIPYVTLSMALPVVIDDSVPPYFTTWPYREDSLGISRNRRGNRLYLQVAAPLATLVDSYRERWNLPPRTSRSARRARLVSVSQLPQCLDFPRVALSRFHYTAPFGLSLSRPSIEFPWDQLDGRPLVYASFGTVMSRPKELTMILQAADNLGYQAVIVCGGAHLAEIKAVSLGHIVVQRAPQLELLERAAVVITHGGLNTVLESLAFGIPVVAIPFVNDQPGIAARIKREGVGELLHPKNISVSKLQCTIRLMIADQTYRDRAAAIRDEIRTIDGPVRAADLIEKAVGVKSSGENVQQCVKVMSSHHSNGRFVAGADQLLRER
jgi:zeaxanthin glucosyltransferase